MAETLQAQIDDALANETPWTPAPGVYTIDRTLRIEPTSGSQQRLNIQADNVKLVWAGGNNQTMVYAKGWKNSVIQGLHLDTAHAANVTAWDLDTPDDAPSTSGLEFSNCQINFGSGGGCIGWRGSVGGNLYGDVSAILFKNCMIRGQKAGDIGWQPLRRNNLGWTWIGGGASRILHIFSNHNPDDGEQHGGGSHSFYGMVATENECDFDLYAPGVFLISGGRFETGKRFLSLGAGGASFGASVKVDAVNIASYTPSDGIVFSLGTAATLTLDSCSVNRFGGLDYDAALITADSAAQSYGAIRLDGGGVQAETWRTITAGQWDVSAAGVSKLNAASGAVGWITV